MNTTTSTILPARRPASERSETSRFVPIPATSRRGAMDHDRPTPFELADRLAGVWSRNERRLAELDALEAGIAAARGRLAKTSAARAVVEAHLDRLLARRAACVAAARVDAASAEGLTREWDARHAVRRAVGG
ncbi:hypothetical protein [Paludisphaera sp.]|uniref:hypothetical protein n=1 Tax=Paludisphaera sp. TaxID=2017432 RepID=UPI00301DCA61